MGRSALTLEQGKGACAKREALARLCAKREAEREPCFSKVKPPLLTALSAHFRWLKEGAQFVQNLYQDSQNTIPTLQAILEDLQRKGAASRYFNFFRKARSDWDLFYSDHME